ncbi:BREX-1 system adenine-specific DNA-methyltransferase PglX [Ruminococcus sp.]|uniref:BREX-1 system adenine-specific DNA-methyltransferase PglX n=1 Tax=Ruminococcus sp. TaxID=41978 RepID=UPI003F0313A3
MNKNAIKKFATDARRELISRVSQKALQYGISEKETGNPNDDSVNGYVLSSTEKTQRAALIAQINEKGYEQVVEEVAYTWFNRFSALRFMEVNSYLPARVRVFTDVNNAFKPQILDEAIHLELDGLDMEKVFAYKEANDKDGLYKYLLITQCNALNSVLPGMFQKISDYTELLFPDNILREGSVIQKMIELIPEDDWKDQVQIIGWLYQYYNSEKKDDVFAALKKNVKITKENIPAATQLFTPDWIVRYMVENSLGRLWLEGHSDSNIKEEWRYYLDEAEQEESVKAQLDEIRSEYKNLNPEQIRFIDPCMGSGHILVYAFDVFMDIYRMQGYTDREAVRSILENNLYGLEIDDRATQLAYFSVMMKACCYDKRFIRRKDENGKPDIPKLNICSIQESNAFVGKSHLITSNADAQKILDYVFETFVDAKEYGSILNVEAHDYDSALQALDEFESDYEITYDNLKLVKQIPKMRNPVMQAKLLSQKYDVVCTNPPYMGGSGMDNDLSTYVKKNYPDSKADLFAVFIEKCIQLTKQNCYTSMVTMQSWMFLSSFEKMRVKAITQRTIANLMHMENMVMGIAFGTAVTVFKNSQIPYYKGTYNLVTLKDIENSKPKVFPNYENRFAQVSTDNFSKIPGSPIAYWVNEAIFELLSKDTIKKVSSPCLGMRTGDNDRFLRLWYEVNAEKASFANLNSYIEKKWIPYNKGGGYRRWYGLNEYLVNWENNGYEIKENTKIKYGENIGWKISNEKLYFIEGITWGSVTSGTTTFRYYPNGFIFSNCGQAVIMNKDYSSNIMEMTAYLNSNIVVELLKILSPTIGCESGYVAKLPYKTEMFDNKKIKDIAYQNVELAKYDWDSYETSWDFKHHPLIKYSYHSDNPMLDSKTNKPIQTSLEWSYEMWKSGTENRFNKLKSNEEELNRIFIEIYGLQDELTPDVADKDITVHRVFDRKDDVPESMKGSNYIRTKRDEIVSFISYAVGCMFGRYSLDVEGIAYAGGEWDDSKYATFTADKDNIIPISDDEYFEDDIVGRFVKFVETVYGSETLQENLKFIADALGGKGQPKEVIRSYFLNDFYKDHCKIYQKRPIYWLFDSGKKNGFKCLIYMHRYHPDTIARIRTDYVHEQQARYHTAIADLENRIANASTGERVKLNKQLKTLNDQATEIHEYEEKIHHLADRMISIDLDDGVKVNYAKFRDVLAKIK